MKHLLSIITAIVLAVFVSLIPGSTQTNAPFFGSIGGAPAWYLNNDQHADSGVSSVTSQALPAFSNSLNNPSIIIVFIVQNPTSAPTLSATDSAGNSYTLYGGGVAKIVSSSGYMNVACAKNTSTAASDVVTVHSGTSATYLIGEAMEFTGPLANCTLDGGSGVGYNRASAATAGAAGANNMTIPSMTTLTNGDLIVAGYSASSGTASAGTSPIAFRSSSFNVAEYYIQPAAGSIGATAGNTSSGAFYGGIQLAYQP